MPQNPILDIYIAPEPLGEVPIDEAPGVAGLLHGLKLAVNPTGLSLGSLGVFTGGKGGLGGLGDLGGLGGFTGG